ncbi:MAG: hypothetical protein H0X43_12060 [Nitrosospira sp.]|nr:hypothetical protein [Nitrosospira sp.]
MPIYHLYSADHKLLYLNGEPTTLQDLRGGNVKGAVATESTPSGDSPPMKNISSLTFEPMVVSTGISMGKSLHAWIRATMDKPDVRKNGYIVAANSDRRAVAFRHFHNALITEIRLPALDVDSRDDAFLTIRFDAEKIIDKDGDGSNLSDAIDTMQQKWPRSSFRLRVGDLPCSHVCKIDSFTIRQVLVPEVRGDFRFSTRTLTRLEIPNLKITFSAADIRPWVTWFNEFVVKGQNSQEEELSGVIEFLDPTGSKVLGSIDLFQVGIFALSAEQETEAVGHKVSRYIAELYVEKMSINFFGT